MNRVTLSVIKADVGSIGGHTKPAEAMLEAVRSRVQGAQPKLLIDGFGEIYRQRHCHHHESPLRRERRFSEISPVTI